MNPRASREAVRGFVLVARREWAARVRSTAFRISTILLLAGTVAGITIPVAIASGTRHFTVAVTAQAPSLVRPAIRADARAAGLTVRVIEVTGRAAAVRAVSSGRAAAAIAGRSEVIWKSDPDRTLDPVLGAAVRQAVVADRAAALHLPAAEAARLLAPVPVTTTRLHGKGGQTAKLIVADVGVILMYLAISIYGGYVLTGVVAEKSSRVVEVLLSRVPPSSLLGGKIAGIGLVGLAQFAAVAVTAAVTLAVTKPAGIPPGTYAAIPALVGWFVLGYALFSTLYGSLGGLASRTEDAQAAAAPVIVLLVLIYAVSFAAMASPGTGWVTVLSILPPASPMIMPLRAALVDVPVWQQAVAAALMLAAIYLMLRGGARIYRNTVLHTGARIRLREAWRGAPAAG